MPHRSFEERMMSQEPIAPGPIEIQRLWEKYEGIAMHFNDLLIRLRTQSLAGVAAVSAVVGIFSKEGLGDVKLDWDVAQAIFFAMIWFWIAIWCLDIGYYNRLLNGAVNEIVELEKSTAGTFDGEIKMSRTIENQFSKPWWNYTKRSYDGVIMFYALVLAVLVAGFFFAHAHS
jgi:hypothetical protein